MDTQGKDGHVKTEAEAGGTLPPAKGCRALPATPAARRHESRADTVVLDFQPPELWSNELLF